MSGDLSRVTPLLFLSVVRERCSLDTTATEFDRKRNRVFQEKPHVQV